MKAPPVAVTSWHFAVLPLAIAGERTASKTMNNTVGDRMTAQFLKLFLETIMIQGPSWRDVVGQADVAERMRDATIRLSLVDGHSFGEVAWLVDPRPSHSRGTPGARGLATAAPWRRVDPRIQLLRT